MSEWSVPPRHREACRGWCPTPTLLEPGGCRHDVTDIGALGPAFGFLGLNRETRPGPASAKGGENDLPVEPPA